MRPSIAGFAVLAALALAGCGSRVIDLRDPPDPDPVPVANSPAAAVERLRWAWNHRDPAPLDDLFTADYAFVCAPEPAVPGELFRGAELSFAERLFVSGSASLPPASAVTIVLGPALVFEPDAQGLPAPWYYQTTSPMSLGIRVPSGDYRVSGVTRFHVVRGDSARIPQELADRGYRPDSTRWWIRRWEDAPARLPGGMTTVTTIKALYLDLLPTARD